MNKKLALSAYGVLFAVLVPSTKADVILTNDALACPSIQALSQFMKTFTTPPGCVELPNGKKLPGPFQTGTGKWVKEGDKFFLVEVPGKGRLWVPASWARVLGEGEQVPRGPETVANSNVWYAKVLRERFGSQLPMQSQKYQLDWLPCLSRDRTKFDLQPSFEGRTLVVRGTVALGPITPPFKVFDGAMGKRYLLHLQAYVFSPSGEVVWSQHGFPAGDSWVAAKGDSAAFLLVASTSRNLQGYELMVLAAGDPILSEMSESRVLLGAKTIILPR